MDITALPSDIFLIIISYLSPSELVLARRVCKSFFAAFTEADLNCLLLHQHYPRVRELRFPLNKDQADWSDLFAKVAARYYHLQAGKPRAVQKFSLQNAYVSPEWAKRCSVATWSRHLQFEARSAPFHYLDTLWTYDNGLLVFPSAELQQYVLYDLNVGVMSQIGLSGLPEDKIVRRIRLKDNVLVAEWCEAVSYHQLNNEEQVHRHFATAFDIIQEDGRWKSTLRSALTILIAQSSLTILEMNGKYIFLVCH
jgi:hypothetical protein